MLLYIHYILVLLALSSVERAVLWLLLFLTLTYPFQKTIQQGAATTVLCAVYPNIEQTSGSFYNDCNIAELKPHAMHDEDAKALWELSEKLTLLVPETTENKS